LDSPQNKDCPHIFKGLNNYPKISPLLFIFLGQSREVKTKVLNPLPQTVNKSFEKLKTMARAVAPQV
jgi:hypothetical protein